MVDGLLTRAAEDSVRRVLISHPGRDSREWVAGIAGFLEPRRVEVRQVFTGSEAIGLVERGGVDAAILSTELPRMAGWSVLRIIRSLDARLPCVMITDDASKRTLQQALDLRAYSVVTQPVDLAALTQVVVGLFRRYFELELE